MKHEPLTPAAVNALHCITQGVMQQLKIGRVVDDVEYRGVVRAFTADADGQPGLQGRDIRDVYVRVTLASGVDVHWPVAELVADMARHTAFIRQL